MTPGLVQRLAAEFPSIRKEVLIGSSYQNIQEIERASDDKTFLHSKLSPSAIRDLMHSVDFAITAAGQTTYELTWCLTPFAMLLTAKNQAFNALGFRAHGIAMALDGLASGMDLQIDYSGLFSYQRRLQTRRALLGIRDRIGRNSPVVCLGKE